MLDGAYSVASPKIEWMKSALPKVPVTRGGATPWGVCILTSAVAVSDRSFIETGKVPLSPT